MNLTAPQKVAEGTEREAREEYQRLLDQVKRCPDEDGRAALQEASE
jgi:hypothetical protein